MSVLTIVDQQMHEKVAAATDPGVFSINKDSLAEIDEVLQTLVAEAKAHALRANGLTKFAKSRRMKTLVTEASLKVW